MARATVPTAGVVVRHEVDEVQGLSEVGERQVLVVLSPSWRGNGQREVRGRVDPVLSTELCCIVVELGSAGLKEQE